MDRKWWVLAVGRHRQLHGGVDGSIVNTILPVIQKRFGCQLAAVQWTVTVYLLAISVLLLSFGRAGDLWGHKRVYLSGFWLFVIGSALCGMSPGVGDADRLPLHSGDRRGDALRQLAGDS